MAKKDWGHPLRSHSAVLVPAGVERLDMQHAVHGPMPWNASGVIYGLSKLLAPTVSRIAL